MANLVTRADFEKYVQLSELGNDARTLDVHILNAQNIDLKQVFGNAFWTDLEANSIEENYETLLNGGTYTVGDSEYSFAGLKAAIVMFTMARRRIASGAIDSPWGMVQKTSEFSQPVSTATRQMMVDEARSMATAYLSECIQYIENNISDFPKYSACAKVKNHGAIRMNPISRI